MPTKLAWKSLPHLILICGFLLTFCYFSQVAIHTEELININSMNSTTTTVVTTLFNNSMMIGSTLQTIAPSVLTATAATSKLFPTRHGLNRMRPHIKDFSPVTLSTEWPSMAKLLVLACLSVIGSIGNVFMISSVMIEDHLKKAG